MSKIDVSIILPEGMYKQFSANMLVVPSYDGEMGIMYNHVPLLNILKTGFIKIYQKNNISEQILIASGLCRFENNKCTILTEKILDLEQMDEKKINEKITRIKSSLKIADSKHLENLQSEVESLQLQKHLLEIEKQKNLQ